MKNVLRFVCIGIVLILIGCNKDGGSNEFNPLAILAKMGTSSLTVHATYYGDTALESGSTGKIFVYLFDTIGTTSRDPLYSASTNAAITKGVESTITVNHIKNGNYYVLVFFDCDYGESNNDNQNDKYILYSSSGNTAFASVATTYTVSGDTVLDGISFGNMYTLQGQSKYITTTASLNVDVTYSGTAATTGTGRLFIYLYEALGNDTRTQLPLRTGSTTSAATSGTITIDNIVPGNYYVVAFFDYSDDGSGFFDSQDDRYVLYNNQQFTGSAIAYSIAAGSNTLSGGMTFGDSYTLQSGSSYMKAPVTLTVKATYTGTVASTGTGNMYVYLYSALSRGTRLGGSLGKTGSVAATVGDEATITIADVDQGDYYMLIFYDYASGSNPDSATDRYILYNGAQYPADADKISLTADAEYSGITFGNDYTFQTNVLGDTLYMQSGSLTVNATYGGTEPNATDPGSTKIGTMKIYVYLYDSLDDSTATSGGTRDAGYLPIYTGSTSGAVTVGNAADITISNILPGSYYMVVFYDFYKGSNPDNQNDRYIIYNNVEFPASTGVDAVDISTGSNSVTGIGFGDDYKLSSGSLFN